MTTNEKHQIYAAEPDSDKLNDLLSSVRAQALRQARTRNRADAEDIAQEASLAVFTNMKEKYDPAKGSFSSWVYTVTSGIMKDRQQRQLRRPQLMACHARTEPLFVPVGDDPVLRLLLEGHTLAAIQLILGMTRKGLRWHLAKLKQQGPK